MMEQPRNPRRAAQPPGDALWLTPFAVLVIFFVLAPVFVVIPMSFSDSNYLEFPPHVWSFRWYRAYFASSEWIAATKVSLAAAASTVILATPIGFLAALAIRTTKGRTAAALFAFLLLPQIAPVILVAIGVFFLYIRLRLVDSFIGIVLAHTALAIPFVITTIGAALQKFDFTLDQAARSLGASRFRAVIDVMIPQIRLSLLAGAIFSFVTSFDEVVVGLFIAGGDNTVLTHKMFLALRDQIDPTIAAISTLMIAISVISVAIFMVLNRRNERRA
jgi:putative spermidine/putrescine transport system permease protein